MLWYGSSHRLAAAQFLCRRARFRQPFKHPTGILRSQTGHDLAQVALRQQAESRFPGRKVIAERGRKAADNGSIFKPANDG